MVGEIAVLRVFRHYVPLGTLVELLADSIIYFGAVLLALWVQKTPYAEQVHQGDVALALSFTLLMLGLNVAFGLYRRDEGSVRTTLLRAVLTTAIGCAIAYLTVWLLSPRDAFSLSALRLTAPYALLGLVALRQVRLLLRGTRITARRALVVGHGEEAKAVIEALQRLTNPQYEIVGVYQAGQSEAEPIGSLRFFPRTMALWSLVKEERIGEVIVAAREQRGGVLPLRDLLECRIHGVTVTDLTGFHERVRGEFPIESLRASWLIYGTGFEQGWARTVVKRSFDLAASIGLLLLSLPVMLLTMLMIKLESRGSVIYRQERVGQGGRSFMCLKFRSMRTDAERDGVAQWAQARDPRVTRVGRFIRKTRIDELPQLLNVLMGDMSLVGPRPERPGFVHQLKEQIPFYDVRHSVKPGLTGWAQVRFNYAASLEDTRRKLQFDLYYVKNHSLFLDFLVLLETIRVVILREGAH
jgi:sugar transferase (PEP-CTERM system associated)